MKTRGKVNWFLILPQDRGVFSPRIPARQRPQTANSLFAGKHNDIKEISFD